MHNRFFKNRPLIIILTLLFLSTIVLASDTAHPVSSPNAQLTKIHRGVQRELRQKGFVKVIVNFISSPMSQFNRIPSPQIASVQNTIVAGLGLATGDVGLRYKHVPAMTITLRNRKQLVALQNNPNVTSVHLDYQMTPHTEEIIPLLGIDELVIEGVDGAGATVAVLDTGADLADPLFNGSVVDVYCAVPDKCRNEDDVRDNNGHGTHIAGIIRQLAPGAKLVIVKVLEGDGTDTYGTWLNGLDYILENQTRLNVDVINMSLGTSSLFSARCDTEFTAATSTLNQLREENVLVFASSGNQGRRETVAAPACIESVDAVAAVYDADLGEEDYEGVPGIFAECSDPTTAAQQIPCFSNTNWLVDFLAPGAEVTVPFRDGPRSGSGTSQASAVASAVAALMRSSNPYLMPHHIEQIFTQTGQKITDTRNNLTIPSIMAHAAVQQAKGKQFTCAEVTSIPESECNALVSIFNSLNGGSWTVNRNWLLDFDPCKWARVSCSGDHVTALRLSKLGLSGAIPASIGDLTELLELKLNGNLLSAEIPVELTNLTKLATLDLGFNMLESNSTAVRNFLRKKDSDWEKTQTVAPKNVNVLATSPTTFSVFFSTIFYTKDDGRYEVACGTQPNGPYDFSSKATTDKETGLVNFTDVLPDTQYYCHVRTITEPNDNNNYQLVSLYSDERFASTTQDGIRDGKATFRPVMDTFVSPSTLNPANSNRRVIPIGSLTDYTLATDPTFSRSRGLLNFGIISLPPIQIEALNLHLWHYVTNSKRDAITVSLVTSPWDNSVVSPGPSYSGTYGSLRFPSYNSNTLPAERIIPLDTTLLPFLRQPNDGIMLRNLNDENKPGVGVCSANSDPLCSAAEAPMLEIDFLINAAPPPAVNPNPEDLAKNEPTDVEFGWESAVDPQGDDVFFELYVGPSATELTLVEDKLRETSYSATFGYGQTIFWKVNTRDDKGAITEGTVWQFRTTVCSGAGLPVSECNALVNFYYATDGESWTNKTNWLETQPCDWSGVTCSNGHVTELNLSNRGLAGPGLEQLAQLPYLQKIILNGNSIQGVFPASWSTLQFLTHIDLSGNSLMGTLPTAFSPNLIELKLANNLIAGTLPLELFNLSQLQTLDLSNNRLSGVLPEVFGNLTQLRSLAVDRNYFEGPLPLGLGQLVNLEKLLVQYNKFDGYIPESLVNLLNLHEADFGFNMLKASPAVSAFVTGLDPDWMASQTIAPTIGEPFAEDNAITLFWTGIPYSNAGSYGAVCSTDLQDGYELELVYTPNRLTTSMRITGLFPGQRYECAVLSFTPASGDQKNDLYSELSDTKVVYTTATTVLGTSFDNAIVVDTLPYNYVIDMGFATINPDDPDPDCTSDGGGYMRSTWIGGDTMTRIKTSGDGTDSALAVYTKDADGNWVMIGCNNSIDSTSPSSGGNNGSTSGGALIDFYAESNTTYYILIIDEAGTGGFVDYSLRDVSFQTCDTVTGATPEECSALVNFYGTTNGPNWLHRDGWLLHRNICTWYGVECRDGHITGLNLSNNRLIGKLNPALKNLTFLENLQLAYNELRGTVPGGIREMFSLVNADFGYNLLYTRNVLTNAFMSGVDPNWVDTQTMPPLNFTLTPTSFSTVEVQWMPIPYMSQTGYYEIGYTPTQDKDYTWLIVPGDKTTSSFTLTDLLPDTTYYVVLRTTTFENVLEPRTLISDLSAELSVTLPKVDGPMVLPDSIVTQANASAFIDVLANDRDPRGGVLEITSMTNPQNGTISLQPHGTIQYNPNNGFIGQDSFVYTVRSLDGIFGSAIVTVIIDDFAQFTAPNMAPVAVRDDVSVQKDRGVNIKVIDNDSDPDRDLLSIIEISVPLNGHLTLEENNVITYMPKKGYVGLDSFFYIINDQQGHTALGRVYIEIGGEVNPETPIAVMDEQDIQWNATIQVAVLANDFDPQGDPLSIVAVGQPEYGSLDVNKGDEIVYKPAIGFVGTDTFIYTITDGKGNISSALVTLNIRSAEQGR